MAALLTKVRMKMSIHAHRAVRGLLDGQYSSIHKGRSMDFDDLRAYVPGDDVKDIDWKATARTGHPLVTRYVAERRHTVQLVVATGRSMAAMSDVDASKRDVAIMAIGVLGYIAQKHGDVVGMVAGDASASSTFPPRGTESHLERLLRHVHDRTTVDAAPADLARTLEHVVRAVRRRTILVIVADDVDLDERHLQLIRRLGVQHELLFISIGDLSPVERSSLGHDVYDVDLLAGLPAFVRQDRALAEDVARRAAQRHDERRIALGRLGVASVQITGEAAVVPALVRLLEAHRHAR